MTSEDQTRGELHFHIGSVSPFSKSIRFTTFTPHKQNQPTKPAPFVASLFLVVRPAPFVAMPEMLRSFASGTPEAPYLDIPPKPPDV